MLFGKMRGPAHREALEDGVRRLGVTAMCLGPFDRAGEVSPLCSCLAGYEPSRRASRETQFRSAEFYAHEVFANERGALLVQPLLFDGEPLGLLTVALGGHPGRVYEQMREAFALGLRGHRLAGG
jgi:hypothetical protein